MAFASDVVLVLVVIIIAIFYTLQHWWKGRYLWKMANELPGPREYPLLGNILDALAWTPEESLQKYLSLVRRYTPTGRLWVGPYLIISVSDPRDLEILMNSEKCLGRERVKYLLDKYTLGDGLIPLGGERWRIHRKFIVSSFQYSHFESFVKVFNKNSGILTKCLTEASSDTNCIDIIQYLTRFAFDSVCETLMGVEMKSQERGEEKFIESMEIFIGTATKMFLNPWLLSDVIIRFTRHHKRMKESAAYMNSFCGELLADKSRGYLERQKNAATANGPAGRETPSLIEAFMQTMHSGECPFFSKDEIVGELNYTIMAGMDTTATALSFAMMLLGFHQDVQRRLQEELDGIFRDEPERPVSTEDLNNLKYTEQVIKETLRLYPLVPFVPRTCTQDIEMKGYTIPKGCDVLFNIYSLHRNPEIYPNPDEFDPENFTPGRSRGRHAYGFVPFSGGMRRCVGHRYAMLQMKVVIAHVLRRFDVRPVGDKEDMDRWELNATLKLVKGFKIVLVPRH